MFAPMYRIWPLLLLGGLALPGVQHVSAIEIYTPKDAEAVNGTNVKLKCTFTSTHPVSQKSATVSWNFRPLNSGTEESVFYYHDVPYPPTQGRFKGHAVWSGDIANKDVSITLHEVPPTFNGTFICQVRNPPDVHGNNGEIVLRVVNKVSMSEISILAAAVGGACAAILILLGIVVAVRFYRKKQMMAHEAEMPPTREEVWRDPTVCTPEEAVHLTAVSKAVEAGSSDDEESEGSSGGDDEEEDGGEEDDDDDDDDDGDDDDDDDDAGGDDNGGIFD